MNHYLQIPQDITVLTRRYLEKLNIAYEFVDEFDMPDTLPGILEFDGMEYHIGEYAILKISGDADKIRNEIETALREDRFYALCAS